MIAGKTYCLYSGHDETGLVTDRGILRARSEVVKAGHITEIRLLLIPVGHPPSFVVPPSGDYNSQFNHLGFHGAPEGMGTINLWSPPSTLACRMKDFLSFPFFYFFFSLYEKNEKIKDNDNKGKSKSCC